ncbi:TonB family protein [Chitinophaga silvisoli]|uniref:TonB family protein n=1 Tax=Chitinophaga silvisoli TaxID=2291814 RepID=A0A3E1P6A4_9BACT|nr:TonB family protein [Chitinophaga silvisoli]RFM35723.1 TonB family protein [Chitinophaga silvisoli]
MQQQNNHIKPVADPELIRRYLAGELDHKAMHALERQALDDPFLAEALEGFEQHAPDQRVNLADLSKRLKQRVQPAKKKVIPMYMRWAAAAAVCFVVGSSIIWLWPANNQSEIAKVTVKTDTIIPAEVSGMVQVPENATMFKKSQDSRKPYRSPVLPAPMVSPAPAVTPSPQAEVAAAEPAPKAEMPVADTAKMIASQNFYKSFDTDDMAVSSLGLKRAAAVSAIDPGQIKGRILNVHGDSGIANVTVSMGTVGTTTDQEGYFSLPANGPVLSRKKMSSNQQLLTAYAPGYKTNSQTYKGDAFVRMQLKRTTDTSTTVINNSNDPSPMGGFDKFELYLAKNVQYPAGLTVSGRVRVQFYVQQDGTLTDFRVLKKLQPECDQEAIRLIKSGPAWLPAANGKAVRVKVDVKFTPEAH